MKQRDFVQVDVFTAEPLRGNPLAVVLDGGGLSTEEMQRYVASQGTVLGRAGRVHVEREAASQGQPGAIWIGGASVSCIQGRVLL